MTSRAPIPDASMISSNLFGRRSLTFKARTTVAQGQTSRYSPMQSSAGTTELNPMPEFPLCVMAVKVSTR